MNIHSLLLVVLITIIWLNSSAGRGVVSRKSPKHSLKQQINKLKKDLKKAEAIILNNQVTLIFYSFSFLQNVFFTYWSYIEIKRLRLIPICFYLCNSSVKKGFRRKLVLAFRFMFIINFYKNESARPIW